MVKNIESLIKKCGFLPKALLFGALGAYCLFGASVGCSSTFKFEAKMVDAEGNKFYATANNIDEAMEYIRKTRFFIENEYKIKNLELKLAEYENKIKELDDKANLSQQDPPKPQQEHVSQSAKTTVSEIRFNEKGEATYYERDKREIKPGK